MGLSASCDACTVVAVHCFVVVYGDVKWRRVTQPGSAVLLCWMDSCSAKTNLVWWNRQSLTERNGTRRGMALGNVADLQDVASLYYESSYTSKG